MMLTDIGFNLTSSQFDKDRDAVLERGRQAGIGAFVVTGTDVIESQKACELASQADDLYCTAGVHPHYAKDCSDDYVQQLQSLLSHKHVVAVGECGLDFNRDFSPRHIQKQVFAEQLQLAQQVNKPLFMHQRDAGEAFIELFSQHCPQGHPGVLHCFTDNLETLKKVLDLGLYIGITGWICDERRGQELRDIVRYIPLDRLMLETDAPYLIPRNIKPKPKSRRNEPMYLPHIAAEVAELLSIPLTTLTDKVQDNCRHLFNINE